MIQGAGLCYGTTWKVIVRTGFPTLFHRRRFVAWIAITAMLAQTLVAGFASAHAAKSPADVAGVICHHDGSGSVPPHAATAAPSFSRPAVVVARSIVRAGQSQAPPRIA
jgi:hypothetical protein